MIAPGIASRRGDAVDHRGAGAARDTATETHLLETGMLVAIAVVIVTFAGTFAGTAAETAAGIAGTGRRAETVGIAAPADIASSGPEVVQIPLV